ncbi:MAG: hypothetical protein WC004_04175 [Candidatus Absconditabacterales bacterium]
MTFNTHENENQIKQSNSIPLHNKEILQRFEDKHKPFAQQCKLFEELAQQFDEAQKRFIRGY